MQIILIFIAIVMVFSLHTFIYRSGEPAVLRKLQANIAQTVNNPLVGPRPEGKGIPEVIIRQTQSDYLIDTYIISGPKNLEIVKTKQVTFKFGAIIDIQVDPNSVYFETMVIGLDQYWQPNYSGQLTVDLPNGNNMYTFLVRAKSRNIVDPIPEQVTFKTEIPTSR